MVKILSDTIKEDLEQKINIWLKNNKTADVKDIKLSKPSAENQEIYAMIIYK